MKQNNYSQKSPTETLNRLLDKKSSDTVFIIGGGPSVKRLLPEPDILEGRDIICTNNAYKLYRDALALHFMDRPWWLWHQEPQHNVKENFNGEFISSIAAGKHDMIDKDLITYYTRIVEHGNKIVGGLSDNINELKGNNTGHQALNIAYHMKYDQVVLIGFDLDNVAKSCHWHNDHKRITNRDMFAASMIPEFELTARWLKDKPMNVYNLNRKSAIRGFTFADLEDFI